MIMVVRKERKRGWKLEIATINMLRAMQLIRGTSLVQEAGQVHLRIAVIPIAVLEVVLEVTLVVIRIVVVVVTLEVVLVLLFAVPHVVLLDIHQIEIT